MKFTFACIFVMVPASYFLFPFFPYAYLSTSANWNRYGSSNGYGASNGYSNGHSNGTSGGYGASSNGYGGGPYGGDFGGSGDKMANLGAGLKTQQWGKLRVFCLGSC